MNNLVYSRYAIYDELNAYYLANKKKFEAYPKIIAFFEDVEKNRVKLNDLGVEKGTKENKVINKKRILVEELGLEIFKNANPAAIYYFEKGDMEMYKQFKFYKSLLIRYNSDRLIKTGAQIIKTCTAKQADLKGLDINAASLKNITTAAKKLTDYLTDPDILLKTKTALTKNIHAIDKETIKIVKNNLNEAMLVIEPKEPKLYYAYKAIVK